MNIYDIAKMAGVSIATVSRVVNGSEKVSEKTKQHVLKIIDDAGYTPNVFARSLGLNTMHTIGILVPDISDPYMSQAVYHLEERLSRYEYNCILACSGFSDESKKSHVQMLISKHIDALILVGSTYSGASINTHTTDYIREAASEVPIFIINGIVDGANIYCTVCNDKKASYDLTTSLIKRGKKRILFLTDSHSYSACQKKSGYEEALSDAGLPVLGDLKLDTKNDIHYVRDQLLQYSTLKFDSAIATDDEIAVGVLKYAAVKGLSVPKDLSIIGYNNSSLSICCEPELTSVDNRVEQVCFDTIDRMISVLKGNADVPPHSEIECELVKRNTTDF